MRYKNPKIIPKIFGKLRYFSDLYYVIKDENYESIKTRNYRYPKI